MRAWAPLLLSVLVMHLWALDVGEQSPSLLAVTWAGDVTPPAHPQLTLLTLWTPDDPIYRSIMPRLTDLQRRHPQVAVLALTAADSGRLDHVLEAMSGRVAYANGRLDALDAFMPPAGLPCSVLVDAHGTVLWWGHPLDAAEPVAEALQGTLHVEGPSLVDHPAVPLPAPATPPTATPEQPPRYQRGVMVERGGVSEPPRQVVVIEADHGWWAWRAWPVPLVPLCEPSRPWIVAPPLPPPLWHVRPWRR